MSLVVVALLSFYPVSSVLICARIWDHPLDHGNFTVPHSPNRVSLPPLADSHCHQLLREGWGGAGQEIWDGILLDPVLGLLEGTTAAAGSLF